MPENKKVCMVREIKNGIQVYKETVKLIYEALMFIVIGMMPFYSVMLSWIISASWVTAWDINAIPAILFGSFIVGILNFPLVYVFNKYCDGDYINEPENKIFHDWINVYKEVVIVIWEVVKVFTFICIFFSPTIISGFGIAILVNIFVTDNPIIIVIAGGVTVIVMVLLNSAVFECYCKEWVFNKMNR